MRRHGDRVIGVPTGGGAALAVSALALALGNMPGAGVQPGGTQQGVTGQITVAANGACLTAYAGGGGKGQVVGVGRCVGGPAQRWTLAGNTIRVQGKCLAPSGRAAGAGAVVKPCDGSAAQLWEPNGLVQSAAQPWEPDGLVQAPQDELVSVWSGNCLSGPAGPRAAGRLVRLAACDRARTQVWVLPQP